MPFLTLLNDEAIFQVQLQTLLPTTRAFLKVMECQHQSNFSYLLKGGVGRYDDTILKCKDWQTSGGKVDGL
jgi:hypothetical protein